MRYVNTIFTGFGDVDDVICNVYQCHKTGNYGTERFFTRNMAIFDRAMVELDYGWKAVYRINVRVK